MYQDLLVVAPQHLASDDITIIPDPPATRPSHIRLDIQGLRAIAVVAVIIYHTNSHFLPGGFVGVDLFFVISGYVIAGVLQRTTDTSPQPLREFYGRRARRLMPAAAVMACVTLAVSLFVLPFQFHQATARWAQASSLLSSNVWFILLGRGYFDPAATSNPFLHTWSLAVEEQFYLVIPALYVLLRKVGRRWSVPAIPAVLTVVGLASFAACLLSTRSGTMAVGPWILTRADIAFYSSPTRAWEFLAGFLISGVTLPAWGRFVPALRGAAVVMLAGCFVLYTDLAPFPGWRAGLPVAATVALLLTGRVMSTRFLSAGPVVAVGDISYGLYLWHWPALVLARFTFGSDLVAVAVALASTAALSVLSYRLLEVRFRTVRRPGAWNAAGLAALCVTIPVVFSVGLAAASPTVRATTHTTVPAGWTFDGVRSSNCFEDGPHRPWNQEQCTWAEPGQRKVFLVGDSHAWSLATMVSDAAHQAGYGFLTWSHRGCPFAAPPIVDRPGCAEWEVDALETVVREKPALVVIANRSPLYTDKRTGDVTVPTWDRSIRFVMNSLAAAGIPVLLVATVPEFRTSPIGDASFLHPDGQMIPMPVGAVTARRGQVEAVEQAIVASTPKASTFDPVPYLCDPLCRQSDGTAWWYYDGDHLTPAGAALLLKPFEGALRSSVLP